MLNPPLATLYYGDVTIAQGCDTTLYGFGNLNVANNVTINGTSNATNGSNGTLVVSGGISIQLDSYLVGQLTVNSTSNLQTTYIDTTLGPFSVSGGNYVSINVGGTVTINSISGNTILESGLNSANAVQIVATNNGGGINILSGQSSKIALTGGSGGIQGITSMGSINLTANNASGSFTVNSSGANQNLTIGVLGNTDSQLLLESSGTNVTNSAVEIISTNTSGNVKISNNNGLSTGYITNLAGSGGYKVTTNTGGPIQLSASDAASYFVVNSTSSNSNLTIGLNGDTNSQLILQSSGISTGILIQNTNTSGSILINQPIGSGGGITIDTGNKGLNVLTQIGGGINLVANGAFSSFINQTTSSGQNLKICVQGTTGSSLILCSDNPAVNAIQINANYGGIIENATGPISVNSSDNVNGISIGTGNTVPVKIGTTTSTTTVYGNLDVRGTTTTIQSSVVQIVDNIIEINNGPSGTADGGIAIKRYQPANNTCIGDVVADVPDNFPGQLAQGGTTTSITLNSSDTQPDNYYNGYWVKIISGTGTCQVRRIKSYNGTTKVALIYTTTDQTGVLGNPTPIQGLNFITVPDSTSLYGLYPCNWIISMWDTYSNSYVIACSNMVDISSTPPIAHYVNLRINNLVANNITALSINGAPADVISTVVLTDNSTLPVTMSSFPNNYGIYIVLVRPTTATATRSYSLFFIGRLNNTTCGQVVRIISVRGILNDQLTMQWPASGFPQLLYYPAPGVIGTTSFTYRAISV